MKKVLLIAMVTISIVSVSCKKKAEDTIYGKWKLTETLFDIGNGKGKYTKVKEDKYLIIERSGMVSGDALPGLKTIKILDSSTIEVKGNKDSKAYIYRYYVSGTSLELNPPCIEACGMRFVRK